jgi:branched-chain amino acid transport system permease protein
VRENVDVPKRLSSHNTLYNKIPYALVILFLIILPLIAPEFFRSILNKIYIFAIFAMGLNVFSGYTGKASLGHAVFFGVGGYTFGILAVRLGINSIWIGLPAALIASAVIAAFIGFVVLRVTGMHLIILTIAFGQLFFSIAVIWRAVTGSTDGLTGIPFPAIDLFQLKWTAFSFHYFILAVFIVCYALIHFISHSSFGYALVGIRENEPRMQSLGYNTWLYKYLAFIMSGIICGLAGVLYASAYNIMVPSNFAILTSATAVIMMTLGGSGTLIGPVIGACIIVLLQFFSSNYAPERWPLILGVIFVLCISLFPGGIASYLDRGWHKLRKKWKF